MLLFNFIQLSTKGLMQVDKMNVLFGVFAFLTIFSAIMTVTSKNPVHSVLYLILTFFSISAHMIMLNAQFLAVVNIIVYAGAIMVLFLFVIMFLNLKQEASDAVKPLVMGSAVTMALVFGLGIWILLKNTPRFQVDVYNFDGTVGLTERLGAVLFSEYMLPFELVSVLFLIAMAGAVMLGKRETGERHF
jgi:NADH-quinone oxidoreductase subunit J